MAGLTLKPSKCNAIPTSEPLSENLKEVLRNWLEVHIPEWVGINILPAAKYLGFYIGPKAAELQWRKAIAKYLAKSVAIGRSGVPASLATRKYNQDTASVLMYLAQLSPLPPNFQQIERTGLFTIYHIATNSMTLPTLLRLAEAGGPSPTNIGAAAKASMFRMAAKTCPCWQNWMKQLRSSVQFNGTLRMAAMDELSSNIWDSKPFCENLEDAWLGYPSDTFWSPSGAKLYGPYRESMLPRVSIPGVAYLPKLQRFAYKILHAQSGKTHLYETVCSRVEKWLGCCPIEVVPDQFSHACSLLRTMRCHESMQVIKTWTNSWATSCRYTETPAFPCLFGCQDCHRYFGMLRSPLPSLPGVTRPRDDFSHYLTCPKMWLLINFIVMRSFPLDPLKRLGLIGSNYQKTFALECCFHAYQSVASMP